MEAGSGLVCQKLNDLCMAAAFGPFDWLCPISSGEIWIGSGFDQGFREFYLASAGGVIQRR